VLSSDPAILHIRVDFTPQTAFHAASFRNLLCTFLLELTALRKLHTFGALQPCTWLRLASCATPQDVEIGSGTLLFWGFSLPNQPDS
jgi:hypothetical protein